MPENFNYVEEAVLTASPKFCGELVPLLHFDAVLKNLYELFFITN